MLVQLDLFDLTELQLYRSRATENKHCHLDTALFVVNFFDSAVKVSEWAVSNTNHFTWLKQSLRLRLIATISHATQNGFCLFIGDWRRLVGGTANEAHHPRSILDQVPSTLIHIHLHQHITWEELAFAFAFLAITHFNHFFSGNQNFAEAIFHASQLYALNQRAHDMLLVTRVSMHNVPTLSHGTPLADNQGNKPAEQGIKPPQQQRHNQYHSHNNQSGLRGFLASWPYDFTNLGARFLNQYKERLALCGLQAYKGSYSSNDEQSEYTVQDRRSSVILIANNAYNHQSNYYKPLEQIEARALSFSLRSHL
ncbi:Secreted protein [Pseudomonas serboccidentalis]